jgi:hypothetical protein
MNRLAQWPPLKRSGRVSFGQAEVRYRAERNPLRQIDCLR